MNTYLVCAWYKDDDYYDDSYAMTWCDDREEVIVVAEELDEAIKINNEGSIVEVRIFEMNDKFKFDFPKRVKKDLVRIEECK